MSTVLQHSPLRPGRTRQQHANEVRGMSVFLLLAYVLGASSAAWYGHLKPEVMAFDFVLVSISLLSIWKVAPSNAHHFERGLILLNVLALASISRQAMHYGSLFYYVPLVIYIVYSERDRLARILLLVGCGLGFASGVYHFVSPEFVEGEGGAKLFAEGLAAALSIFAVGFCLRRFRRFNETAVVELTTREDLFEQHVTELREGREKLLRNAEELERLKEASSASILREHTARAQIEAQAEEMRQFAYAASHDLKEPVRTIRSFVQMTRRRLPPDYNLSEESAEFFDYIDSATGSMSALLDRLLLYSRAERISDEKKEVPLARLLLKLGSDPRIIVNQVPTSLEGIEISVAVTRVEAIAGELLANALCFSESKTMVEVGVQRGKGESLELYVRDRGIGVPEAYHERVFGLFQRLHSKDDYPGHGVGLALCRRLLDGQDHKLRLQARAGGGTEALLLL